MVLRVDSASNRNEYQEYFNGVKAAGAYGWQLYHLHVPTALKSGSPSSWNTPGLSRLRMEWLYLYLHCRTAVPKHVAQLLVFRCLVTTEQRYMKQISGDRNLISFSYAESVD
jgi:hypothetical protein